MTPNPPAQFDQELAVEITRAAVLAADIEALKPRPVSAIRNPDGSPQHETEAEHTSRLVSTAVLHLLEQGLLVIPPDVAQRMERGIPLRRNPAPATS